MNSLNAPSLLEEYPLLLYPSLAKAMGVNKALVFQQLHFLLKAQQTSKNEYVFINERWWVYNSYQEWKDGHFSWLETVTLQRIFASLEDDGLVLTMQGVKNKSDRRKWYTIDYKAWESYRIAIVSKIHDPSYQNDMMVISKRYDGYSETPSETPTKKKKIQKKAVANAPANRATPKKIKKTKLQTLLEELIPLNDLVNEMLSVCEVGYTKGFQRPSEYMTIPHLEKYLPMAAELQRFNCVPTDIKPLYDFIDNQEPDRQWNIAPQTLVRKYHEYASWKKEQSAPKQDESPNGGIPTQGKQITLKGKNPFTK